MMASTRSFSFVFDNRPLDVLRVGECNEEIQRSGGGGVVE